MTHMHLHRAFVAGVTALTSLFGTLPSSAHCLIGKRELPMTSAIGAPCVMDELMAPMFMGAKNGDDTSGFGVSGQFSRRLTEDFGVMIASNWSRMWMSVNSSLMSMPMEMGMGMPPMNRNGIMPMPMLMPSMSASGWQNLQTTFKYQFYTIRSSEFIMSAGVSIGWGHTGNRSAGAQRFTSLTPMVWFGKGLGDLPTEFGWVRAFAVTGQFGLSVPTWRRTVAISGPNMGMSQRGMSGMIASAMDMSCMSLSSESALAMIISGMTTLSINECRHAPSFVYGAALQYSFSYLRKQLGSDVRLPSFMDHVTPLIEAQFHTPLANSRGWSIPASFGVELAPRVRAYNSTLPADTVGTINPGVIWSEDTFQIGAEAIIPINRQSGRGVGWMVSVDLYLHRLFPEAFGRPLFSLAAGPASDDREKRTRAHERGGPAHRHAH
jgi:hypothetical protein